MQLDLFHAQIQRDGVGMSRKRGRLTIQPFLTTSPGGRLLFGCAAKYGSLANIKRSDSRGNAERTTIEANRNTLASR
jgi:hypothetical protein